MIKKNRKYERKEKDGEKYTKKNQWLNVVQ